MKVFIYSKGEIVEKAEMMPVHSGSHKLKQCPKEVPMNLLNEKRAEWNHSQSLKRLKERGGMGVLELLGKRSK